MVELIQKSSEMSGCDDYVHALVSDDFYDVRGRSTELDAPVEKDIAASTVPGFLDTLQRYIEGDRSAQLNSQSVFEYLEAAGDNNSKEQPHENSDGK